VAIDAACAQLGPELTPGELICGIIALSATHPLFRTIDVAILRQQLQEQLDLLAVQLN
jgi:hypothetical protein